MLLCLHEHHFCLQRYCSLCWSIGMLGLCVHSHYWLDLEPGKHCCLALAVWERSKLCVWGPMGFGLARWGELPLILNCHDFTFVEQMGGSVAICTFNNTFFMLRYCQSKQICTLNMVLNTHLHIQSAYKHVLFLQKGLKLFIYKAGHILSTKGIINIYIALSSKCYGKQNNFLVTY